MAPIDWTPLREAPGRNNIAEQLLRLQTAEEALAKACSYSVRDGC